MTPEIAPSCPSAAEDTLKAQCSALTFVQGVVCHLKSLQRMTTDTTLYVHWASVQNAFSSSQLDLLDARQLSTQRGALSAKAILSGRNEGNLRLFPMKNCMNARSTPPACPANVRENADVFSLFPVRLGMCRLIALLA